MSGFSAFAATAPAATPTLPLVHTTDWYEFQWMKGAGGMHPTLCDVHDEAVADDRRSAIEVPIAGVVEFVRARSEAAPGGAAAVGRLVDALAGTLRLER